MLGGLILVVIEVSKPRDDGVGVALVLS